MKTSPKILRILVVEDNGDLRYDLIRTIHDTLHNVDILTADNEKTAKKKVKQNDFDAIITDINLVEGQGNETGGLEIIEYTKMKYPKIPVIVVTAYGQKNIEINQSTVSLTNVSSLLGAVKVITRPDPDDDYLDLLSKTLLKLLNKDFTN